MSKRKNTSPGFDKIAQTRELPPLVLDQKWHQLFLDGSKPAKVAKLEQKVSGH